MRPRKQIGKQRGTRERTAIKHCGSRHFSPSPAPAAVHVNPPEGRVSYPYPFNVDTRRPRRNDAERRYFSGAHARAPHLHLSSSRIFNRAVVNIGRRARYAFIIPVRASGTELRAATVKPAVFCARGDTDFSAARRAVLISKLRMSYRCPIKPRRAKDRLITVANWLSLVKYPVCDVSPISISFTYASLIDAGELIPRAVCQFLRYPVRNIAVSVTVTYRAYVHTSRDSLPFLSNWSIVM